MENSPRDLPVDDDEARNKALRAVVPQHLQGTQLERDLDLRSPLGPDMLEPVIEDPVEPAEGRPGGTILHMETSEDYGHGDVQATDVFGGPH